jgi:hypothetical protein
MVTVLSLWLPILVSAVLVFAASSVIHMFLGYHASDYGPVPGEETVGAAIREAGVPPGDYAMPYAGSMKAMGSPEFIEKMNVFILVVSVFAGYVASRAVGPGADFASVFRFAGTTAFAAYALGSLPESIWFGRKWSTTLKTVFDGIVYMALTGAVFGWLWPGM